VLAERGANLHWYGKHEARPLRKLGHVTLTGNEEADTNELLARARELRDNCTFDS
jgi:5-(carboxyamino)imidazole ribonucleotide synthase